MRGNRGFTLVEILVAMVILAIGLLGMAAMTTLVVSKGKETNDLTAATNICQVKVEELKDVSWEELGSAADTSVAGWQTKGLHEGDIVLEGGFDEATGLNGQGKLRATVVQEANDGVCDGEPASCAEAVADAAKPYKFRRSFVICQGREYTDGTPTIAMAGSGIDYMKTPTPGAPPATEDCNVTTVDNTRTRPLTCLPEDIATTVGPENKEKKIKVLCAWRSRDGQCHSVSLDTTVVDLN